MFRGYEVVGRDRLVKFIVPRKVAFELFDRGFVRAATFQSGKNGFKVVTACSTRSTNVVLYFHTDDIFIPTEN